jgi:Tfp pilus assembly protein PilO
MKKQHILLFLVILATIAVIVADIAYVSKIKKNFIELEKQRIITSNKLATAKIVHENLNHVRELVVENMDFPGQTDTLSHETHLFKFITTCINDLKLELIGLQPQRPKTEGRITTYSYDIELEGDFFKFGEICSKFENSRRIVSLQAFNVELKDKGEKDVGGPERKVLSIKMYIDTYRVKKSPDIESATPLQTAAAPQVKTGH